MPTQHALPVPCPERIRRIPHSFGWVDHRVRKSGRLQRLKPTEIGLYLFLVLAADKQGLSCWSLKKIQAAMPCFSWEDLLHARHGLRRLSLRNKTGPAPVQ